MAAKWRMVAKALPKAKRKTAVRLAIAAKAVTAAKVIIVVRATTAAKVAIAAKAASNPSRDCYGRALSLRGPSFYAASS
ncbi:MAG: hypothetical protein KDD76_03150 [Rickettsiales bacterium]|nr:hypothetical protein [Rickettsiales bacterium]